MERVTIERDDLAPLLAVHPGNRALAAALRKLSNNEALVRALGRYIYFNASFGGCVANLAGEIAVRQELFRDPEEPVELLADRSVDVASDIFFAAIDEFDDRATSYRDTHRSLAQATLKAAGQFYGMDAVALNRVARPNEATLVAIRGIRAGYGVSQVVDEPKLFRAIGFHLGSEILADEEFRVLDGFLHERYGDLVAHLERTEATIGGRSHQAYFWIRIHTSVEADHFAAAVRGANSALHFYAGKESRDQPKRWMLEGFGEFAGLQAVFMQALMEG
jgi:hypothetical protein